MWYIKWLEEKTQTVAYSTYVYEQANNHITDMYLNSVIVPAIEER